MAEDRFSFGDRIIHAQRPEWGAGTVTAVASAMHEGRSVQRVTVRFERAGLKTLSTGVADLRLADGADHPAAQEAAADESTGWLGALEAGDVAARIARLPEAVRDPFASLADRLRATLDLYRFSDEGGPLLDWAAVQTGLKDPLSRFSRHELEEHFRRYAANRDEHLVTLLREAKRTEKGLVDRAVKAAPPAARTALRRFNASR